MMAKQSDEVTPIWSEAEGGRAAYCQHGVDSQVHCCVCHSGFVFNGMQHEPECIFETEEHDPDLGYIEKARC